MECEVLAGPIWTAPALLISKTYAGAAGGGEAWPEGSRSHEAEICAAGGARLKTSAVTTTSDTWYTSPQPLLMGLSELLTFALTSVPASKSSMPATACTSKPQHGRHGSDVAASRIETSLPATVPATVSTGKAAAPPINN